MTAIAVNAGHLRTAALELHEVFPVLAPMHGSATAPTRRDVAGGAVPIPPGRFGYQEQSGPLDLTAKNIGFVADWIEARTTRVLKTGEARPQADIELGGVYVHYLLADGTWHKDYEGRFDGGAATQGWTFGTPQYGAFPTRLSAAGNRLTGWGDPTWGNGYVTPFPMGATLEPEGTHGWISGWPQEFLGNVTNIGDATLQRNIRAYVLVVEARAVGADAADWSKHQMILQPGLDIDSNPPSSVSRGGWSGRFEKVTADWKPFVAHTMSLAMIAANPPTTLPGWSATPPPVVTPPTSADVTHKVEVRTQVRTDGGAWKSYPTGGFTV